MTFQNSLLTHVDSTFGALGPGREHWAWMIVVEVWQGTLGVDGRG